MKSYFEVTLSDCDQWPNYADKLFVPYFLLVLPASLCLWLRNSVGLTVTETCSVPQSVFCTCLSACLSVCVCERDVCFHAALTL